jgi:hypothetical protein
MSGELYTFVAGRALENDTTFNVKCNCGGDASIKPKSTAETPTWAFAGFLERKIW